MAILLLPLLLHHTATMMTANTATMTTANNTTMTTANTATMTTANTATMTTSPAMGLAYRSAKDSPTSRVFEGAGFNHMWDLILQWRQTDLGGGYKVIWVYLQGSGLF